MLPSTQACQGIYSPASKLEFEVLLDIADCLLSLFDRKFPAIFSLDENT